MDILNAFGNNIFWWSRHAYLKGKYHPIGRTSPWISVPRMGSPLTHRQIVKYLLPVSILPIGIQCIMATHDPPGKRNTYASRILHILVHQRSRLSLLQRCLGKPVDKSLTYASTKKVDGSVCCRVTLEGLIINPSHTLQPEEVDRSINCRITLKTRHKHLAHSLRSRSISRSVSWRFR